MYMFMTIDAIMVFSIARYCRAFMVHMQASSGTQVLLRSVFQRDASIVLITFTQQRYQNITLVMAIL